MILDDCGADRRRGTGSPRSVDRVDGTVGALKEGYVGRGAIGTGISLSEQGGLPFTAE